MTCREEIENHINKKIKSLLEIIYLNKEFSILGNLFGFPDQNLFLTLQHRKYTESTWVLLEMFLGVALTGHWPYIYIYIHEDLIEFQ